MENEKVIKVDNGVLTLKVLAEALGQDAQTVAQVLTAMNDENLDFVVDTMLESQDEADIEKAIETFNSVLEQIRK